MKVHELAGTKRFFRFGRPAVSVTFLALLLAASSQAQLAPKAPVQSQQQYQRLVSLAEQRIISKDYRGAMSTLKIAVRLQPNSLPALGDLGVLYALLGDYAYAADAYERALRFNPDSFPLLVNLGLAYFKSGKPERAVGPIAKAVSLEPTNLKARTLLAMSYYGSKDFIRASAQFEKLVADNPNNRTLQFLVAQSYLQSGQNQKLLNYFQPLLKRLSASATFDMLLGEADDGLDRTREAIEEFRAARALAPTLLNVNFGLGYLYWKTRQYSKAAAAFQREMEIGGNVARAEAYWGDIVLREGKQRQARALLDQAVRNLPKQWIAHCDLGILDVHARQYAQAELEFQEAIEIDPQRVEAHYRLAQVYRAEGKIPLAKAQLNALAQIHQSTAGRLYTEISGGPPPQ